MPFHPRTDVVLDVINAADPARASLAAERLAALARGAPASDFAADLDRASASAANAAPPAGLADGRARLEATPDAPDAAARVKVEFEAMMLNSFVGEMLPKDASVFGGGAAGDMWRSMLSEQVSRQIAKSGALGLSRRLFATHELAPHERAAHAAPHADAAEMSANILSAPSAAEVVGGAFLFAGRRRARAPLRRKRGRWRWRCRSSSGSAGRSRKRTPTSPRAGPYPTRPIASARTRGCSS